MDIKRMLVTASITALASCGSVQRINLICEQPDIEIYVNDEYAGSNLVSCTVPRGTEHITVSGRKNGEEVYSRRFYVKGKGDVTFDLAVPDDLRYSDHGRINR